MAPAGQLAALLVDAVGARTEAIEGALRSAGEEALLAPSALPGWSRLTIACHLRYGAEAFHSMTHGALAGAPTSYYPEGRDTQRDATLV